MASCVISPDLSRALLSGTCADPFSALGFQRNEHGSGSLIRVFNPAFAAVSIEVREGTRVQAVPCENSSGEGCFEAFFPDRHEPFAYRVCAFLHSGATATYDDPYAFGPVLSDFDLHLIGQGTHYELWKKLGANPLEHQGVAGVHFAVWAPNAMAVSVLGDFNGWSTHAHAMRRRDPFGVWEIFAPRVAPGSCYKFRILGADGLAREKMDPVGRESELRPRTGSIVPSPTGHAWSDADWQAKRMETQSDAAPIAIYEVHLGSWQQENGGWPSYKSLSERLIPYARRMGYTHLEFMPLQEHPLDESWGYQVTGYYAPTRRYGSPQELKGFIDACHAAGLGVILDWVPAHFPEDAHGLGRFDGTELYAHEDPRRGMHKEWGTRVFNYGRREVTNFLIANALYWLEEFHLDGLRVDAVASMLYLDYDRKDGDWLPGPDGGNINHEAVEFFKHLNSVVAKRCPNRLMIAEESTAFPGVTAPPEHGGLGFNYKWNMGWMHDFLTYMSKDPVYRRFHHDQLTFEMSYAFSERFILPLSHDECVHGKGSLLRKMPGDDWQKFANTRAAFAYFYAHPGKKLHFMGMEFGQWDEWKVKASLDWHLADSETGAHAGLQNLLRDLNRLYRDEPALHALDLSHEGFQWIDFHDRDQNVLCQLRRARAAGGTDTVLAVFNFSPQPYHDYRVGVPRHGFYTEILNTDSVLYGGGNVGNTGGRRSEATPAHNYPDSVRLTLPPLAALFLKLGEEAAASNG
jgi:1,4-alpha-glucan branching enzyme